MQILKDLHGNRWGDEAGAFRSPRFTRFHNAVMPALFDRGVLDLRWLTVDGEPLSAIYNIRWNGKIYCYQSGRRMNVPPQIRVGIVQHAAAIKEAIVSGCREYDFLGGDVQYKRQMSLDRRPLCEWRVARTGANGRV